MKCSHAISLFDEYLKQTISLSDKQELTEHLKTCASCQKQWEAYRFFFENSNIEEDFLVPSQLNAKIKYTIHQAKNNKKVPFFQNKQLLAGLTACSFLLVGAVFGTSYYQQLKDARTQPDTGIVEPMVRTVDDPSKMAESISDEPNPARALSMDPTIETKNDTPAYLGDETENAPSNIMMVQEAMPTQNEVKISDQWQEKILIAFPHEVLTEDTYLVMATKEELEQLLGCSVDADESASQLTIQFVKLSN